MPKVSVGLDNKRTEDVLGLVGSPSIVLSELVKNSIDSNADIVNIYINTNDRKVIVVDDGNGLDENHIKNLGSVGESDKKEDGKEKRKDGKYYSGSKGLGLLSSFSLSDYIEIETKVHDKAYLIQWGKGQSSFDYKQIDNCELISNHGTKVTIKNIKNDDMNVLLDQDEHKKLRHITIRYFNNVEYKDKQINFYVDGKISNEFECCDINTMDHRFVYRIKFNYISENNKLEYWFDKSNINNKINKSNLPTDNLKNHITINLSNNLKINDIIKSNYRITKTVKKDKKFSYLSSNLEDFYGQLYIIEGQSRGKKDRKPLEDFGYGVKVFINDFAIYDYLDNENDWLGFGMLSQNIKNTTLRPHNVFGYVNFDKFNEKNSNLEIANERTNFIEKAPYKKFIEIMKDIVVKIAFEVDVAYRLKNIDTENYFKDLQNDKNSNTDNIDENELKPNNDDMEENKDNTGAEDLNNGNGKKLDNSNIDGVNKYEYDGNKKTDLGNENESESHNINIDNTKKTKDNEDSNLVDENDLKINNSDTEKNKGNNKHDENSTLDNKNKSKSNNSHRDNVKQNDVNKSQFNSNKGNSKQRNYNKLNRKHLIPSDFKLIINQTRVNKIFRELKQLDVNEYNNAVAVLFRVFIEFSVDLYIQKKHIPKVSNHSMLHEKITEIKKFMEGNNILSKSELKPVMGLVSNPNDYSSVNTFNAYVHNYNEQPLSDSLKQTWDNIELFIKKLWD